MTEREYKTFCKIQHHYHVLDAEMQVELFFNIDWDKKLPTPVWQLFDFDELADRFEMNHDRSVADNDQWQAIIKEYIEQMAPEEQAIMRRHGLAY